MNNLHVSMYKKKLSEQERRLLAYWIMTYGLVRLVCGLMELKYIASITFMVEVAVIYNEWFIHKQIITNTAISVIIISAIFGILCLV